MKKLLIIGSLLLGCSNNPGEDITNYNPEKHLDMTVAAVDLYKMVGVSCVPGQSWCIQETIITCLMDEHTAIVGTNCASIGSNCVEQNNIASCK